MCALSASYCYGDNERTRDPVNRRIYFIYVCCFKRAEEELTGRTQTHIHEYSMHNIYMYTWNRMERKQTHEKASTAIDSDNRSAHNTPVLIMPKASLFVCEYMLMHTCISLIYMHEWCGYTSLHVHVNTWALTHSSSGYDTSVAEEAKAVAPLQVFPLSCLPYTSTQTLCSCVCMGWNEGTALLLHA